MAYTVEALAQECAKMESGRSAWIDKIAAQSIELGYTVESLGKDGSARAFIAQVTTKKNEILNRMNKDGNFEASKTELSKWCTAAHPKVRGNITAIRASAEVLAPKYKAFADNVFFKIAAHLKSDSVSSIETAAVKAEADLEKKGDGVDTTTHEGFKTSLTGKLKTANAKKLFTDSSLAAVVVAIAALEAVKVTAPATVTQINAPSPEAPADIATILSGINSMDLPAADKVALIQQLLAK